MIDRRTLIRSVAAVWAVLLAAGPAAVTHADPVARWGFGSEETSRLTAHGGVFRDQPGPRPPEFPDFEANNLAVRLDGSGAHFSFADPGDNSPFDFADGDAITLEAWVNMADAKAGENLYVIGKGRTGDAGFARDNQNWALRVREAGGAAHVSFLFATPPKAGGGEGGKAVAKDAHWHRWTSTAGFAPGSGWHHVAAAYRFGDPESVRGWVDDKPTGGAWDMGGPTREPPVVDNDAVWIGSSQGGSASNSFRGWLDEIAVHREVLSDDVMRGRFRRGGAGATTREAAPVVEAMPAVGEIPAGRVLVTFHEGLTTHDRWPKAGEMPAAESARWAAAEFVVPRLPLRYDEWGIRSAWKPPVLVRAAADVRLPPGKQKFLVRARGLSRLWVNGAAVARTKTYGGSSDGHEPVPPLPDPPGPGLRPVGYGDQEAFGEFDVPADGRCRVVLEAIVGGKKLRAEPGEMCVAVRGTDGQSYFLLGPDLGSDGVMELRSDGVKDGRAAPGSHSTTRPLQHSATSPTPLTDAGWDAAAGRAETELTALDDATRHTAAATQEAFWQKRHDLARQWVTSHPAPPVPAAKGGAAIHPIDAFLADKIDRAVAASAAAAGPSAEQFHAKVLPVLSEQCFRCHGEKEKGGLKLNSREAALKGGVSGVPAVVPGDANNGQLLARLRSKDPDERMPPKGDGLSGDQIAAIEAWVNAGAPWPAAPVSRQESTPAPVVDDASFLRRAYLDTVGVPPTAAEARAFLSDTSPDKRPRLVDRLVADPRLADGWMGYWQDVLAENPNILKPSLNNSGPFRWFLYESFRDAKPLDRLVTELVLMRGDKYEGGSAGFGMAADNDAPLAAKGQVLAGAFLGVELQCARCHDSPFHSTKQRDLYALAAMLDRKPATVPKSSTVPAAFFERKARESLIKVTLKPGEPVAPAWPFANTCGVADDAALDALLHDPKDTRERLSALITAPQNQRFARVTVNRVWRRLIGAGLVEPAHDWEGHPASHPELLDWLAREFVAHDYDLRHVVRLVMTSQVYQREATGRNRAAAPDRRFFAAPDRRRLTGEQVADSLFAAAGRPFDAEELTFDPGARQQPSTMITLGRPRRAWQFASLSNERDRPSLSLPRAQAVTDILEAFGWSGSRQNPRTDRETGPNVLQPGVLANGVASTWATRAGAGGGLAEMAVRADSPDALVDAVFLGFLSRPPAAAERARFAAALAPGFAERLVPAQSVTAPTPPPRLSRVSWSNHLVPEATTIKIEMERRARAGDPPDPRLVPAWREAYEDVVWAVVNTPEFVWVP